MDTTNLSGRTVVVTGAGSGIGRETALLAARRGADIAICDVDEAGLDETARRAGERVLVAQKVDVADRAQVNALANAVHAERDAVDLLVNNAGVGLAAPFLETEPEDWEWIVSINLMGVVNGSQAFLPRMVERGRGGHVANLSSLSGYVGTPTLSAYSATKFAVLGLSEAMREELHPHRIGVSAICPGIINTPITHNARSRGKADDPATRERIQKLYARRNYGPDKVAVNILKAVERNRTVAPVSPESWLMYGLKRVSPRLVGTFMRLSSPTR